MTNSMVYKWKSGTRFPVTAQEAAEHLHVIKSERGTLTPRHIVDDASDGASPLNPCFEWNDSKAADEHRLQQARELVGNLVVVSVEGRAVHKETRGFVHVNTDGRPQYESIDVAFGNPDMRSEVLARARREIAQWRQRYEALEEFSEVHAAIDRVLSAVPTRAEEPGEARLGVA